MATLLLLLGIAAALLTMDDDPGPLDTIASHQPKAGMVAPEPLFDDATLDSLVPSAILALSPQDALARNLALPISRASNPLAPPFVASWLGTDLERSTTCLANAVYYEANGEPMVGQRAVAQVVLNRLRHPRYPKTICDVVYQGADRPTGCQFSFTCDGSLARAPNPARWKIALGVATAALEGWTSAEAGQATHYHTLYVFPKWAPELLKTGVIGHHVFYRLPGRFYDYAAFRTAAAAAPMVDPALPLPAITPDAMVVATSDATTPQINPAPVQHAAASSVTPPAAAAPIVAPTPLPTPSSAPTPTPRSYFPNRRGQRSHLPLSQ